MATGRRIGGLCRVVGVDVNEGVIDDDFGGREWEATLTPASEAVAGRKAEAEKKREDKAKADDGAVLAAMDPRLSEQGEPFSMTRLRLAAHLGKEPFGRAVERLCADGLSERIEVKVKAGKGAERPAESMRRKARGG